MAEEGWLTRLKALVGDRRVIPTDPPGRSARGPNRDAEPPPLATSPDQSAAWSCFITYTDSKGEESARTITIERIFGHFGAPETIYARCHLRNEPRSFKVAGITGMACAVSGEELDPLENCLALHRTGALKIEDLVLTRMMRMLTFMARCDGEFHSLEHGELEDALGRYFRFFGGDDAAYACAMTEAPRLAPSGEQFLKDLRWLARAPQRAQLARFAIDSTAGMIEADHRHHPSEIDWGLEVSGALRRIAGRA